MLQDGDIEHPKVQMKVADNMFRRIVEQRLLGSFPMQLVKSAAALSMVVLCRNVLETGVVQEAPDLADLESLLEKHGASLAHAPFVRQFLYDCLRRWHMGEVEGRATCFDKHGTDFRVLQLVLQHEESRLKGLDVPPHVENLFVEFLQKLLVETN